MEKNGFLDSDMSQEDGIQLNNESKFFLKEATKWAKFLAIAGFVLLGLFFILGVYVFSTALGSDMPNTVSFLFSMIISIVIYVFPTYYLYMASVKMKQGLTTTDVGTFNNGLEFLKSFFKYIGVLMIIVLSIYFIVFLVFLLTGLGQR